MSNKTVSVQALIQLLNQLQQAAQFYSRPTPLQFYPKTQYIRSDWDNANTRRLNKDTFVVNKYSCLVGGFRFYKGYVAEVVGRDPATGERIYFINFSGFYYYDCGQYKRL
ncbi:hypothetical protein Q4506_16790 [Colwellia sp. 4_MG-2023]|uniref:hypothetical protein n=1 Tax=unclassified Colwellia TaxID=196834 RepID=UPI0026E31D43|nr:MULTISPECIES: hypothetical protein [unclassified Colwellia]MDO6508689.1 hypothetical protein [Colwellia sp. 5_MG-2023]MDO6557339.1 hypothetical protein [Colwellia sp. 4_MG-2023]